MAISFIMYIATSIQLVKSLKAKLNNNDLAIRYRNLAILYGVLCIAFFVAFLLQASDFSSNNQFNYYYPMDEKSNATTLNVCPWIVNEHGSAVARVNFNFITT